MQPVGGLNDLDLPDLPWPDDDVDGDGVYLDVVVGVEACEDKAAGRDAGLVVTLTCWCGADQAKVR